MTKSNIVLFTYLDLCLIFGLSLVREKVHFEEDVDC